KPIPDELFVSNISTHAPAAIQTDPVGFISPTLDGDETSYLEWLGAGSVEVRDGAGAMHQTDRQASIVTLIRFGFDRARLYVRVDGSRPMLDVLAEGFELSLRFLQPEHLRFSVRQRLGRLAGVFSERGTHGPHWVARVGGGAVIAAGALLEVAVPWSDLGVAPGDPLAFL